MVIDYKGHTKRIQLAITWLGKQHILLSYSWLQKHSLEITGKPRRLT
jgi:hypothetical protein